MANNHIIEYLKQYFESKTSPRFAVMVKGRWEVGKLIWSVM